MKRIISLVVAVIFILNSVTIIAFADTPNITMTANKTNVKAGDTITVTVNVAENSYLCSATLDVVYDNEFYELVPGSLKSTEAMGAFVNENYGENIARYAGTLERYLKDEATLFTVQFKVLKRGGSITLDAVEVYYVDANLLGERKDVTAEVKESLKDDVIKVPCPHADNNVSEIAPTCTTDGRKVETCKECGFVKDTVILKLGHKGKDITIKEATCSERGKVAKECTVCGAKYDEKEVEKLPHKGEDITIKEATCTEKGRVGKKCTVCGTVYDEKETATVPHEVRDFTIKEATCSEKGKVGKKCTMCSLITDEKETETVDHNMQWTVTKPATCTQKGVLENKCIVCCLVVEKMDIDMLSHDMREFVIKNATCEEAGIKIQQCNMCNYIGEETTILPTGHNYMNGKCINCGKDEPVAFSFEISEPTKKIIRCNDGIILHAKITGNLPQGAKVEWLANNDNFSMEKSLNENKVTIISKNKGYTTITALVYDADGQIIASDTIEMYSKAGFFDKIGGFFRSLFGTTKIYEN